MNKITKKELLHLLNSDLPNWNSMYHHMTRGLRGIENADKQIMFIDHINSILYIFMAEVFHADRRITTLLDIEDIYTKRIDSSIYSNEVIVYINQYYRDMQKITYSKFLWNNMTESVEIGNFYLRLIITCFHRYVKFLESKNLRDLIECYYLLLSPIYSLRDDYPELFEKIKNIILNDYMDIYNIEDDNIKNIDIPNNNNFSITKESMIEEPILQENENLGIRIFYLVDVSLYYSKEQQLEMLKLHLNTIIKEKYTINVGYGLPEDYSYDILILDYGGAVNRHPELAQSVVDQFIKKAEDNPNKLYILESDIKEFPEMDFEQYKISLPNLIFRINNIPKWFIR